MKKQKTGWFVSALAATAGAALLLGYSSAAAEGARRGLAAVGEVILPSVFPFLVFSVFLVSSPAGAALGRILSRPAAHCYRLPEAAAPALLPGLIGGYPAGAGALAELLGEGKITREDARFGALCLVHCGPAFLTGAVGEHLFGSTLTGIFLFLTQLAAGLLSARILMLVLRRPPVTKAPACITRPKYDPFPVRLLHAVAAASSVTLKITAFVVLCSAASEILTASGVFPLLMQGLARLSGGRLAGETARCHLTGLLEVSAGTSMAAGLPPAEAAKILPFLLSFGGLSVMLQAAAPFEEGVFPWGRFFLSRLLHGTLTALLARPWLPGRAAVGAMTGQPELAVGGGKLLWGCCTMLLLTLMLSVRWEAGERAGKTEKSP